MVSGVDHVWDTGGDWVHPVLPQIPVGLVHGGEVTTFGTSLVGDLAGRQGVVEEVVIVTGRNGGG